MAARPRTLPAAIAPVLVGTAAAIEQHGDLRRVGAFIAALIGSIFIQIGTNLANDYSDAKRGADTVDRLGPVRVTSAGLVAPRRVLIATWLAFGVAIACRHLPRHGRRLGDHRRRASPRSPPASSTPAAPGRTATPGLGEFFVFLFFGLVAVNGSYYVQLERLDWLPFGLSVAVGFLATAILVVNNVRDIDTDRRAGKNTLAVRLGPAGRPEPLRRADRAPPTRACSEPSPVDGGPWWALLGFVSAPLALKPARAVLHRTDGPSLNGALAGTGALLGVFSLTVSAGLLIAA